MPQYNLIFESILKDIPLTDEEKQGIEGVYITTVFKDSLELFISLMGNKPEFVNLFGDFYDKAYKMLDQSQSIFDEILRKRQSEIIRDIVAKLQESASDDVKKTLEDNLKALGSK